MSTVTFWVHHFFIRRMCTCGLPKFKSKEFQKSRLQNERVRLAISKLVNSCTIFWPRNSFQIGCSKFSFHMNPKKKDLGNRCKRFQCHCNWKWYHTSMRIFAVSFIESSAQQMIRRHISTCTCIERLTVCFLMLFIIDS